MAQRARVEFVGGRPDFGWYRDSPAKPVVDDLAAAVAAQRLATARVEQLVNDARLAGVSWSVIGWCLGVSRQTAHRIYGGRALV